MREDVLATNTRRTPKLVGLLVFLVVGGLIGAWLVFGGGTSALKLATTHQPEPFTELYFLQPTKLPEVITPGKAYSQSFAIVNHDFGDMTYTYQLTIKDKNGIRHGKSVAVRVKNGQRVVQTVKYVTRARVSPVEVTVSLLGKDQSIHFRTKS